MIRLFTFSLLLFASVTLLPQAEVLLVLGSDTAIWEGMGTATHDNYYNTDLYVNPARNTYPVMDPAFRQQFTDSYGTPVKMTWWMMAGNIFRYATNKNMPVPNIMTLYLMKKYHMDNVIANGDELTLHYHTFGWTDYNNDGAWYWNQTHTFMECKEDFDVTLAQFLIEEDVFPVSFRSGWHYMDNGWQEYLNELLPYSLHNDHPHKRTFDTEPIDNIYDWSQTTDEWVPYKPHPDNYQLPGGTKGWNVRSKHMQSTSQTIMDSIFMAAANGTTQVPCLWAHLPEDNFLESIAKIDSLAHISASRYPGVNFRYCTAIEAYQRWLGAADTASPDITITESIQGDEVFFTITADELIFQKQPFTAVKTIYEDYFLVNFDSTGTNQWQSTEGIPLDIIAKVSVAVTDTLGNLTTEHINYLPDVTYIDNDEIGYHELYGNWTVRETNAWGVDSRIASIPAGDSAAVSWTHSIDESALCNIFLQFPETDSHVDSFAVIIDNGSGAPVEKHFSFEPLFYDWIYITTTELLEGGNNVITVTYYNNSTGERNAAADVIKISPLVRNKDLNITPNVVAIDFLSANDTSYFELSMTNMGIEELSVLEIESVEGYISSQAHLPITIEPMSTRGIELAFFSADTGSVSDTIIFRSNDPRKEIIKVPFTVKVQNYFVVVDNGDEEGYEEYGEWHFSSASGYNGSSRYSYLDRTGDYARYTAQLNSSGSYILESWLPSTVNAGNKVMYDIKVNGQAYKHFYVNQNTGSGGWRTLTDFYISGPSEVIVTILNTGESTEGAVTRADALKFRMTSEVNDIDSEENAGIPNQFALRQNYPNPFNPSTVIAYELPEDAFVNIAVYAITGEKVAELLNAEKSAGYHKITFNADGYATGIYLLRIEAASYNGKQFTDTKKMLLLR